MVEIGLIHSFYGQLLKKGFPLKIGLLPGAGLVMFFVTSAEMRWIEGIISFSSPFLVFSYRIWSQVLGVCMQYPQTYIWDKIIMGVEGLKSSCLRSIVGKVVLVTTVYHIWIQKNTRIHIGRNFFFLIGNNNFINRKSLNTQEIY